MSDLMKILTSLMLFGMFAVAAVAQHPLPDVVPAESVSDRLLQDLHQEIIAIEPLLDRYGYGVVFVAVGIEGLGIPAPGQTLLIAGAVTAANHGQLHISWLLLAAFLAALLGNSLGYWIGRRGGRSLLHRLQISEHHLQRVERGFARYGSGLVVIGRFFDGLRQLNGIVAGLLEMPWWKFTLYNTLGAVLWVGGWGLGVYYLDERWHGILVVIRHLNPWITSLTLAGFIGLILMLWHNRHSRRVERNT